MMEGARFCQYCGYPTQRLPWKGQLRPVCTGCGVVVFLDPKVVAGVIVDLGGKLVMVRRARNPGRGLWSFPAGYVDRGETVEQAAVREAREETGLDVRITGLVGVYSRPADSLILVVYAGQALTGPPRAGEETQAVGLFDLNSLPPLAFERDAGVLEQWRVWQQSPGMRPPWPGA